MVMDQKVYREWKIIPWPMGGILLSVLCFQGCLAPQERVKYDLPLEQGNTFAEVEVFYATDRELIPESTEPDELFGSERSGLSFGTCRVSIPHDHELGQLEAPSLWRLEVREDPDKHVVLLSAAARPKEIFFTDLRKRIEKSQRKNAFLFVHGYNVSFAAAARRTAQMAYDLAFDGAPVFYSWPSEGSLASYGRDEETIVWAQANLQAFLVELLEDPELENIYLIAHSMGSRALTGSLLAVQDERPELMAKMTEIILAAPDIDAELFRRDIAPALVGAGRPMTLYASSEDLALTASKKVHGGPRLGDSGEDLVILEGVETIDATGVDTSLIGHSYFADTRSILSDLYYLVHDGQRAEQRFGLQRVRTEDGVHWRFRR